MLERSLLLAAFLCVWSSANCSSQQAQERTLSLAECEQLALQHHPSVHDAVRRLDLAEARSDQAAHARYLPSLTLGQVIGPIPDARGSYTSGGALISPDTSFAFSNLGLFTQVDFELIQPIWTFGKLSSLTTAARFGVEAERAGHEATTTDVLVQIRTLFWGLLLGYELLDLVGEMLTEVDNAQSTIQTKLDDGADDVSQTDLFKIQVFRYEVEKRQREAMREIEIGKATLRTAMGLDESVNFELAPRRLEQIPLTVDSLDFYVALALDNRPEIAQLRAGIAARSALVRASTSDYLPQFYVGAQIQYNRAPGRFDPRNPFVYNPTNFFRPGVVLGMRWNLNLIQTRDIVRTARIEQEAIAEQEPILTEGVRLDVRTAYLALKEAERNILDSRLALRASQNWLRSETQTFDLGIGEVKDLIDAYQTHSTMRSEHLRNIFSFNTALAKLAKAVGRDLYPN